MITEAQDARFDPSPDHDGGALPLVVDLAGAVDVKANEVAEPLRGATITQFG